jgi:Sulfatase-modifying factor enzyme 1
VAFKEDGQDLSPAERGGAGIRHAGRDNHAVLVGGKISTNEANYNRESPTYGRGGETLPKLRPVLTRPVDSFQPNPWGLYQVHGNVWEWVEDCWNESYQGAPSDGSAWTSSGDCRHRVLRGGSGDSNAEDLRSASRHHGDRTDHRCQYSGFRVGRALTPESLPLLPLGSSKATAWTVVADAHHLIGQRSSRASSSAGPRPRLAKRVPPDQALRSARQRPQGADHRADVS